MFRSQAVFLTLLYALTLHAAARLTGTHDFSAFRAAECQARSPVKTLHEARVERASGLIVCRFRADAFLHHMIRNLMGALIYVGAARQPVEWIGDLLRMRDRSGSAPTFAAAGLYLTAVEYPLRHNLPAASVPPMDELQRMTFP